MSGTAEVRRDDYAGFDGLVLNSQQDVEAGLVLHRLTLQQQQPQHHQQEQAQLLLIRCQC